MVELLGGDGTPDGGGPRVHHHEPADLAGVGAGVQLGDESALGVRDEHVGLGGIDPLEDAMEVVHVLVDRV